jgi:hypothetical protein
VLPNTDYQVDDPATPATDEEACPQMPAIRVCVRDNLDPICGDPVAGFSPAVPGQCSEIAAPSPPWSNTSGGMVGSHAIEVRVCYRFTTLFNLDVSLPFGWGIHVGDIYLQRTRLFVLDCPPPPADLSVC